MLELTLPSIKKYRLRVVGKTITLINNHNHEVDMGTVHVDILRAVHTALEAHNRGEYYTNP